MQTMKGLNQFTTNLFVKQSGDAPNLVRAVRVALDKGVKTEPFHRMTIKAFCIPHCLRANCLVFGNNNIILC